MSFKSQRQRKAVMAKMRGKRSVMMTRIRSSPSLPPYQPEKMTFKERIAYLKRVRQELDDSLSKP